MSTDDDAAFVERIYAASIDAARWSELLVDLGTRLRAQHFGVLLRRLDNMEPVGRPLLSPELEQLHHLVAEVLGVGMLARALVRCEPMVLTTGDQLAARDDDVGRVLAVARQRGIAHFTGTWFPVDEDHFAMLGFCRAVGEPALPKEQLAVFEGWLPHLRRGLEVYFRLDRADIEREAFASIIDTLTDGLVVLDRCGRIVQTNRRARELLVRGDGLERGDGRELMAATCEPPLPVVLANAGHGEPALAAVRRPGAPAYLIWATDVTSATVPPLPANPATAVFIIDPERRDPIDLEWLTRAYGLTQAEARVTALLAEGLRSDAIADQLQVSVGTVRNQLKQAFAKTNTNAQPALVSLVLKNNPRTR